MRPTPRSIFAKLAELPLGLPDPSGGAGAQTQAAGVPAAPKYVPPTKPRYNPNDVTMAPPGQLRDVRTDPSSAWSKAQKALGTAPGTEAGYNKEISRLSGSAPAQYTRDHPVGVAAAVGLPVLGAFAAPAAVGSLAASIPSWAAWGGMGAGSAAIVDSAERAHAAVTGDNAVMKRPYGETALNVGLGGLGGALGAAGSHAVAHGVGHALGKIAPAATEAAGAEAGGAFAPLARAMGTQAVRNTSRVGTEIAADQLAHTGVHAAAHTVTGHVEPPTLPVSAAKTTPAATPAVPPVGDFQGPNMAARPAAGTPPIQNMSGLPSVKPPVANFSAKPRMMSLANGSSQPSPT